MALRRGDYMQDLVSYIENNLKRGYREDQLRFLLMNQGYSRAAIEKAFRVMEQNRPAVVEQPAPKEVPRVEFIESALPSKRPGFFSRLFSGLFSSKPAPRQAPIREKLASDGQISIDSSGNLM